MITEDLNFDLRVCNDVITGFTSQSVGLCV